jgi:hypothetical protein
MHLCPSPRLVRYGQIGQQALCASRALGEPDEPNAIRGVLLHHAIRLSGADAGYVHGVEAGEFSTVAYSASTDREIRFVPTGSADSLPPARQLGVMRHILETRKSALFPGGQPDAQPGSAL